ncbi:MAG: hypothetical protein A2622_00035 [Bdellovibrionales bacterium RIFCSPHIGHO2_01_FULL_40_29]|nr:MAG: hypothetical protein A2622_00035 [Bdellovibrionales bacterium RIFCSPHIGHO2_01_FULL_40_29]OFZ32516.1 MAG: hypothetical protein A3D17_04635 [Bdellovibrionales bacterium RIFCSPHIGHO2_02_FULL_40_15]
MRNILALCLTIFSINANAKIHMFWCSLTNENPNKQVYFEINDLDVDSGIGILKISKKPMDTDSWNVFETAQVRAKILWTVANQMSVISGIEINMGKKGNIAVSVVQDFDQYNNAAGVVKADLFRYHQYKLFDNCTYFLSTGPKPALTGSN